MAGLNGKWKLVSTENFMEYCKAIGTTDENLQQAKVLEDTGEGGLVEEYNFDGKTLSRKVTAAGGKLTREQNIPVGEEISTKALDGKDVKIKLTASGDTITRVEKGDGYEATWVRKISGDDMTVDISVGSVKCVRKYKRI